MKRLLLVLVMLAFNFANAQKIKTTDSFDIRITSKELKKTHKNKFVVTNELTLKDGSKIKIGDTFQLGESARKSSDTYASITMGRLTVGAALAGGVTYASATMIEADYILKDIKVTNYYGLVRATFFLKHSTSTSAISYITATDASLDNGELINLVDSLGVSGREQLLQSYLADNAHSADTDDDWRDDDIVSFYAPSEASFLFDEELDALEEQR